LKVRAILILFTACLLVDLVFVHHSSADTPSKPGDVTEARVLSEASTGGNWLVKGGSFDQQQFSSLKQINDKNVKELGLAWWREIDSPMGLASEPIVVDGVIYLSAPESRVYAIEGSSGRILWVFRPRVQMGISTQNSYAVRVNRGVAVWEGKVYVSTGDCRLLAIDAASGKQLWDSQICDPAQTGSTGAPRVAKGKIFIGYNGSDDQIRGSLVAFDAESGKEVWRFWTVPGDPAKGFETPALEMAAKTWKGKEWWWHGGGNVWDAITYDSATGLLLFSTAGAHKGEGSTTRETSGGEKLFAGCIVAVNPDNGEYVWHFQTSTENHQTENLHIVIADITLNGEKRHVAMTVPKNGTVYVLDAKTGKLLSAKSIVDINFETPNSGRSEEGEEDSIENAGRFGWTVHNWWPMSYSPATGLTYIPITDRRAEKPEVGQLPFIGRLVAWDAVSQSERWSVPQPIAVNSGVLSTSGNLVFQGQGNGEFAAYAADSGKKLWSIQTASAIDSVPVSFAIKGEQYVLVPVGWGSASRIFGPASMMTTAESKRGPSRLLAFKLEAKTPFPFPRVKIPPVPRPPQQKAGKEVIEAGKALYESRLCAGCHSPGLDGSGAWTVNGAIPDLRYMPPDVHKDWYAIVLAGTHKEQGMLAFGGLLSYPEIKPLTVKEADAIHAYIIDESWKLYRQEQHKQSENKTK
jgi:quinohemoprotein ethanol dehydrogenase